MAATPAPSGLTVGRFPRRPPAPRWAGPALEPTSAHLAAAGITIDGDTATPDWYGERLDLLGDIR